MKTPAKPTRTRRRWAFAALYLALLAASAWVQTADMEETFTPPVDRHGSAPSQETVTLPMLDDEGPVLDGSGEPRTIELSYLRWTPDQQDHKPGAGALPAVIYLHGSPGLGTDFRKVGPLTAAAGREAFSLDMPGYGGSTAIVPRYSALSYARTTLAFMDALGVERAHAVGWSFNGATVLHMADLDERAGTERVASATLLNATGVQETEGSGSRSFELLKYAAGYAAAVILPELVPHFGVLGPREWRHAFARNFLDTDQRLVSDLAPGLATPVLVLHGRHDPLIADWAAEDHHEAIPSSRLVMTEHSHFLPYLHPGPTSEILLDFFARHDEPGVPPLRGVADHEPVRERLGFAGLLDDAIAGIREVPWPALVAVIFALALRKPELTTALAGLPASTMRLDFGVAFLAILLARQIRAKEPWRAPWPLRLPGDLFWTAVALTLAQAAWSDQTLIQAAGPIGLLVQAGLIAWLLNLLKLLPTRERRQRLRAAVTRWTNHEWWPPRVFYGLLIPHYLRLARRHGGLWRGLTVFTCVNPGVKPGGGLIGESKTRILEGWRDAEALIPPGVILPYAAIPPSHPTERAALAKRLLAERDDLAGYPCVLKPDLGYRGAGVRIAHDERDVDAFFRDIQEAAILQRYDPGPQECGVFWIRRLDTVGREQAPHASGPHTPQGFVYSINRKTLPTITGDGRRTLRRLIMDHPRLRIQWRVFFDRFADELRRVPEAGQTVRLGSAANHGQGCLFTDGADLITPELDRAVDRLAASWRGPDGQPFDFGRFDLRYGSEDDLKRGEGFTVLELNGVTGEPANLFDPNKPARWSLGVAAEAWRHAYAIGAARRDRADHHATPLSLPKLLLLGLQAKLRRQPVARG